MRENPFLESYIAQVVERLRSFESADAYWVAFSGGKDSQTIYRLCSEAGVTFDAHYNATTVDPPELVRFIKNTYPDVKIEKPERNMAQLIVQHMFPPTRLMRYCCQELKERGGTNRVVVTGVRWAESNNRRLRRGLIELQRAPGSKKRDVYLDDNLPTREMVEFCAQKGRVVVNPIIDWTDNDVWDFLHTRGIASCSLYGEGYKRLGCVACPLKMGRRMRLDLERWPHFKTYYVNAFDRMVKARLAKNKSTTWTTGRQVLDWWVSI